MRFLNQTSCDALCFSGLDLADDEFRVVVVKVGYKLNPTNIAGKFVAETLKEPALLCLRDEHYGAVNASSIREESDLAHYKPRCDVIVRGSAYAPKGVAAAQWSARIKVSATQATLQTLFRTFQLPAKLGLRPVLDARYPERGTHPVQAGFRDHRHGVNQVLLDKALQITGPREFFYRGGWRLSESRPTSHVPLRWEHAFGGTSAVRNPLHAQDSSNPEFLLNEVCYTNPLGCGWIENRYFETLRKAGEKPPERLPAPQIALLERPILKPAVIRHPDRIDATNPDDFIRTAQTYGESPAGFGAVGRSWVPRLQMAGTYDAKWQNERWPLLPDDFDFGYWNCAPRDQQIDVLPPDARIELWNLADPDSTSNGYLCFDLPGDWPLVLLRRDDDICLPLVMKTDTLVIDTDTMTVTLTHRFQFSEKSAVRSVEARLHREPDTA
ncbi:DUF2169 domain-containing protein [Paraburkholderia sp. Tr-20389]|uniref:DUF2169 family type VI secretion system accessory protein n=1 Tax=Paraburkholderia sp. Tr-20389 TaxID=2703903 RepID=UPI00197D87F1|nr:DUF2169 domain-containing protein [Paraburkholderia sp. Tr-20389]MBN3752380.1 DUF2169 domain-containing protein [Paraburkholderia sp. Tr-20389]